MDLLLQSKSEKDVELTLEERFILRNASEIHAPLTRTWQSRFATEDLSKISALFDVLGALVRETYVNGTKGLEFPKTNAKLEALLLKILQAKEKEWRNARIAPNALIDFGIMILTSSFN